jgi:hypothetical protein
MFIDLKYLQDEIVFWKMKINKNQVEKANVKHWLTLGHGGQWPFVLMMVPTIMNQKAHSPPWNEPYFSYKI